MKHFKENFEYLINGFVLSVAILEIPLYYIIDSILIDAKFNDIVLIEAAGFFGCLILTLLLSLVETKEQMNRV